MSSRSMGSLRCRGNIAKLRSSIRGLVWRTLILSTYPLVCSRVNANSRPRSDSTTRPITAAWRPIFRTRIPTVFCRPYTIPFRFESSPRRTSLRTVRKSRACCVKRDSCSGCWRTPRVSIVKRVTSRELSVLHPKVR
jgi:hypothetical protein